MMYRSGSAGGEDYRADRILRARKVGASRRPRKLSMAVKRSVDISSSLLFFAVFAWFFLVLWLCVRVTQGGPAIYRHKRVGLNGEEFECLKFRSMIKNSDEVLSHFLDTCPEAKIEWDRDFKLKNDPRITPFGRFLRKTSLDELPQFWNVLKGDMSLVGPRPVTRKELDKYYGEGAREYGRVRPGLTGPWQVSGRHAHGYSQRVAIDLHYVQSWTVVGDIKIVGQTISVVLLQDGSC
jgi:exopolysaccharide production protein ExoY